MQYSYETVTNPKIEWHANLIFLTGAEGHLAPTSVGEERNTLNIIKFIGLTLNGYFTIAAS